MDPFKLAPPPAVTPLCLVKVDFWTNLLHQGISLFTCYPYNLAPVSSGHASSRCKELLVLAGLYHRWFAKARLRDEHWQVAKKPCTALLRAWEVFSILSTE